MDDTPPTPVYVQPPPDPAFELLKQQSEQQNIDAMRAQATLDTARLMQQFGIRSALGGAPLSLSTPAGVAAAAIGAV